MASAELVLAVERVRLPVPPAPEPALRPGEGEGALGSDRPVEATDTPSPEPATNPPITGATQPEAAASADRPAATVHAPTGRSAMPAASSDDRSGGARGTDPGTELLRRIEAGDGPSLELGWPVSAGERRRVADHLTRCAGLTVALLARDRLWRLGDPPGRAWVPDPVRLSGILRRADGVGLVTVERIRVHHGLTGGVPVALVARGFDSRLLDGLARVAPGGRLTGHVRARYGLRGGDLVLSALEVDGRPVPGVVRLARIGRCG